MEENRKKIIVNCFIIASLLSLVLMILLRFYFFTTKNIQNYDYTIAEKLLVANFNNREKYIKFNHDDLFSRHSAVKRLVKLYISKGDYLKAIDLYEKYISRKEFHLLTNGVSFSNEEINKANVFNDLGYLYEHEGNFKMSEFYYKLANKIKLRELKIAKNINDSNTKYYEVLLGEGYNNIGKLKLEQKKYEEAKSYFDKSINILSNKTPSNPYAQNLLFENAKSLSEYYYKTKDFISAEIYAKKMFFIIPDNFLPVDSFIRHQSYYLREANQNMANLLFAKNDYAGAKLFYTKVLRFDEELYGRKSIQVACDYYYLSFIYNKVNNKENYDDSRKTVSTLSQNFINSKKNSPDNHYENMKFYCK